MLELSQAPISIANNIQVVKGSLKVDKHDGRLIAVDDELLSAFENYCRIMEAQQVRAVTGEVLLQLDWVCVLTNYVH